MVVTISFACELVAAGLLGLISWQDWRARSVSWPIFPVLAACLLVSRLDQETLATIGWQSVSSLLVLGILVGTLALYVRLRFRAAQLSLWDCLGSGDVVFWLAVAVYLPPARLLLFLLGSSLMGLLLVALGGIRPLPGTATLTIPLAGIQAGCLLLLLGSQWLFPTWLLSLPTGF